MVIKLSDYILEQSISGASIDDIGFEQLIAEMDVCCKLAMAYNKQLLMESYFQEDGEATASTSTQQPQAQPQNQQTQPSPAPRTELTQTNKMVPNTAATTNAEQGFFKTVFGYIKKFFQWIGSKLTGISADAVRNIKFVEYYTLNASEQDIVQFIENKHVNIEWYNPKKVTEFVDGLEKASAKLWLNYKRLNKNFIANNLGEFEKALNVFNAEVQKSGWVKQNNINEQIDVVQTFKTYVKEYSNLFKKKDVNNEQFMKTLAGIKPTLEEISTGLESITNTDEYKQLSQEELMKAKAIFVNMQKTIKAATAQIMNVTNAYTALKEFAVNIKAKLDANPNDEKRGTVQRRWEGPTNIVNAQ